MKAFQDWLRSEIHRRDMSDREFARFAGTTNSTISRLLTEDTLSPSVETIVLLSKATGIRSTTLLELAYPEIGNEYDIPIESRLAAERIMALPPDIRAAYILIIDALGKR